MSNEFDPRRDLHQALLSEDSCAAHGPLRVCESYEEADWWNTSIQHCSTAARTEHLRWFARNDLYFLLVHLLNNEVMAGYWPGEKRRSALAAQWFFDRTKEVEQEPNGYCDQWSRGAGKAIDINEPVFTTDGWKKHGELIPGDRVFGPDGKSCKVLATTPISTTMPCSRVTFDDGYSVVVSNSHLWGLQKKRKLRVDKANQWRVIFELETILTTDLMNHSRRDVGVTAPIELPEQTLPIDPYCFGAWLGDGNTSGAQLTCSTDDFLHFKTQFENAGHTVTPVYPRNNCLSYKIDKRDTAKICIRGHNKEIVGTYRRQCLKCKSERQRFRLYKQARQERILSFGERLRQLNLARSGTPQTKHVPEIYLRSSVHQRLALLQGLMDTDGYASIEGAAVFTNTNRLLVDAVFALAASLGFKPHLREKSLNLPSGRVYVSWNVEFRDTAELPAFRLARKLARRRKDRRRWRMIRSVEPVEPRPVSCIQVNRPDGMYLVGKQLVPTHNSTIITYAKTIQDILIDPEQTFCILSHTRPIAKAFLTQIKVEFEKNQLLKDLFPDILYQDPEKESIRWSLDEGIVVKRKGNPRESTVAAFGLVDSMPTGHHYSTLIYDDVVTEKATTTPDMIEKVQRALDLSINLGATRPIRFRMIGTPYAVGDPYDVSMERGFAKPRIRPAIVGDESLLWSMDGVSQLKQSMSPRMFALQILMDRKQASEERGFRQEWICHWSEQPSLKSLNRYILVDPGGKGEESTSYTAIVVVGLGPDKHIYILDLFKDRISLVDRINIVFELHRKYDPMTVFYERYSMQSDIDSIKIRQAQENYRFNIVEVGALSNRLSKERRIEKVQPEFSQGLILLPPLGSIKRMMHDGKEIDLVENFIQREYLPFPFSREKDLLDALSRIKDERVSLIYPKAWGSKDDKSHWQYQNESSGSWMAD